MHVSGSAILLLEIIMFARTMILTLTKILANHFPLYYITIIVLFYELNILILLIVNVYIVTCMNDYRQVLD
jgi:hypothetical protein